MVLKVRTFFLYNIFENYCHWHCSASTDDEISGFHVILLRLTCRDTSRMSHSSPHRSSTDTRPETVVMNVASTPICGQETDTQSEARSDKCEQKRNGDSVRWEAQNLVDPEEVQLLAQGDVEQSQDLEQDQGSVRHRLDRSSQERLVV